MFLLLIIILTAGGMGQVTTTTVEFSTERSCLEAGAKVREITEDMSGVRYVKLACVRK